MKKNFTAFSLIEILVVIGIFAIISVIISRATISSFLGSRKSDATIIAREDLSNAMGTIERELRASQRIVSACNSTAETSIQYIDQAGDSTTIQCILTGNSPRVELRGQSITSSSVNMTDCSFTCNSASGLPPSVNVVLEGVSARATGNVEPSPVILQTLVNLRAY